MKRNKPQILLVALFAALFIAQAAWCADPVRIGVLAYRAKDKTLEEWRPIAAALKKAIPEREFVIDALIYSEMSALISERKYDFLLTNPGHFINLRSTGKLTSPIATLSVGGNGGRITRMGGVMVARADRGDIGGLADIRGKTVAVPGTDSLGGYQTQAYELFKAGVKVPGDVKILVAGMPHDNVIDAVADKRADVGFIRNGVIEAAERDGKLSPGTLKVISQRDHVGFPHKASTALYPEWPFAAFIHTDERLSRRVASALFALEERELDVGQPEVHTFSVPADYAPVEKLLREMRFPPFNSAPEFTPKDVWERYRLEGVTALAAVALITFLGVWLVFLTGKLRREKQRSVEQAERLRESEARLMTLIETEPECVKQLDAEGKLLYMNRAGLDMIEADTFEQVAGVEAALIVTEEYREAFREVTRKVFAGESATLVFETQGLKGGLRWLETHSVPLRDAKGAIISLLSITRDITEQVNAEREREAALAHIKKLEGILPICMYCKKIRDKDNSWDVLEHYISKKTDAQFSHGICPDCLARAEKEAG